MSATRSLLGMPPAAATFSSKRRIQVAALITLFAVFVLTHKHHKVIIRYAYQAGNDQIEETRFLNTSKGATSYAEIEAEVYVPLGYQIADPTEPIPTLAFIDEPKCSKVFSDWIAIAKTYDPSTIPPRTLPENLISNYTLNGYSRLNQWYINEKSTSRPLKWYGILNMLTANPKSYVKYGNNGMAVYHATKYFNLKDQTGLVIGSLRPWAEVFALRNGAKKVTTVEYQKISVIGNASDRVDYLHPFTFAEKMSEYVDVYDFAISFSSIEHSGMGRYGDPMDPIGDIREVLKTKCLLKSGGLFFLGLPRGQDGVTFNVHRVYGRMRLGLMFAGFTHEATFRGDNPDPINLTTTDFDGVDLNGRGPHQDVWVLRKI